VIQHQNSSILLAIWSQYQIFGIGMSPPLILGSDPMPAGS